MDLLDLVDDVIKEIMRRLSVRDCFYGMGLVNKRLSRLARAILKYLNIDLKKGGIIDLYIPPSLAYGCNPGSSKIPQNAMLIFRVELVFF